MNESDLPLEIWLTIFRYATYIPEATSVTPMDPFQTYCVARSAFGSNTPLLSMRTKCSLVLVCRSWRKIAVQLLYEHIAIRSSRKAALIVSALTNSVRIECSGPAGLPLFVSEYGQWTRHIEVYTHSRGASSRTFFDNLFRIFHLCPNVRILSGMWAGRLPHWLSTAIPRFYGVTLRSLRWDDLSTMTEDSEMCTISPESLTAFQSLCTLDLRGFGGWSALDLCKPNLVFPCISNLLVSTHPSSLETAAALALPSLRYLVLEVPPIWPMSELSPEGIQISTSHLQSFLIAHGTRIHRLEFNSSPVHLVRETNTDTNGLTTPTACHTLNLVTFLLPGVCPDLRDLVFEVHEHLIDLANLLEPHPSLRRIGLRGVFGEQLLSDSLRPKRSQAIKHLLSFSRKDFPNLEVVRTLGFLGDAANQATADILVQWCEFFGEKGIDLQDGDGVVWLYDEEENPR